MVGVGTVHGGESEWAKVRMRSCSLFLTAESLVASSSCCLKLPCCDGLTRWTGTGNCELKEAIFTLSSFCQAVLLQQAEGKSESVSVSWPDLSTIDSHRWASGDLPDLSTVDSHQWASGDLPDLSTLDSHQWPWWKVKSLRDFHTTQSILFYAS